ncbi:MAG: hypothetical protein F7C37_06175 [Desulfurococcales archaeon]|nr:hypothetical protein [Desulfurococcales archaeon]
MAIGAKYHLTILSALLYFIISGILVTAIHVFIILKGINNIERKRSFIKSVYEDLKTSIEEGECIEEMEKYLL